MFLFRLIGNLITVVAWGLAGNWTGERMRQLATGEPGHQTQFYHTGPDGELVIAANPLITNLVPAVVVGMLLKPHWLWALVTGVISSGLMGERSERVFFDLIRQQGDQVDMSRRGITI
jgi:hypothetical protein